MTREDRPTGREEARGAGFGPGAVALAWSAVSPPDAVAPLAAAGLAGIAGAALAFALVRRAPVPRPREPRAAHPEGPSGLEIADHFAHEMRSPLNAVVGLSGLLLDTPLDSEQREAAATIRSGADSLHRAIEDFLDLARIGAGRFERSDAPFSPRELLEECVRAVRMDADERSIPLRVSADPGVPQALTADAARIRRILVVLLDDALRRNHGNGIAVAVGLRDTPGPPGTAPGPRLAVVIRDEGAGSTPRDIPLGPAVLPAGRGRSGEFRISAVRIVCEHLGGRVWSEPGGGGSAVHAEFPVATADVAPPPHDAGAAEPPLRVLVADDDAVSRAASLALLRSLGHDAEAVSGGREALDRLRGAHPGDAESGAAPPPWDVVLLDGSMPGMDGFETARGIPRNGARRPLLVALTATATDEDREAFRAAGFDACIAKPLLSGELCDVLRKAHTAPPDPDAAARESLRERLAELYAADVPGQLARLRDAAARGDARRMESVGHRLKGSSAIVGDEAVHAVSSEIERLARSGDVAAAREAVRRLDAAWLARGGGSPGGVPGGGPP